MLRLTDTILRTREIIRVLARYDPVRQMRASSHVLGPLTARTGDAKVSIPGDGGSKD
jgi:UDP-N-acetylglucosamine 1-carboxyvinyltransferase